MHVSVHACDRAHFLGSQFNHNGIPTNFDFIAYDNRTVYLVCSFIIINIINITLISFGRLFLFGFK